MNLEEESMNTLRRLTKTQKVQSSTKQWNYIATEKQQQQQKAKMNQRQLRRQTQIDQ